MGWDKPFVYGPLLAVLSAHVTLWLPTTAQAASSRTYYGSTQSLFAAARPARHVAALRSSSPPAPPPPGSPPPSCRTSHAHGHPRHRRLGLGSSPVRPRWATTAITAVAIAAHLSHLIVASACIAAAALLRRTIPWRPLASLAAALTFLLASNAVGHGRLGISPYGSVFALARLIGDGPARDYLDRTCPAAGINRQLCAWRDKLTSDSDQFLWDPQSPFWADPAPLPVFAAEAATIVRETVLTYPARVLARRRPQRRPPTRRLPTRRHPRRRLPDRSRPPAPPAWFPADASSWARSLQPKGELPMKAAPPRPAPCRLARRRRRRLCLYPRVSPAAAQPSR